MNFCRDVVDAAPPDARALVELCDGQPRREWSFAEVSASAAGMAGTLRQHGVGRGDVVLTMIGNRSEWVVTMVACFRIGAIALACSEQLRAHDLSRRLDVARPKLAVVDGRHRETVAAAAAAVTAEPLILDIPDPRLFEGPHVEAVELEPEDPCLLTFTSGTSGEAKAVLHAQRYLMGQMLQAEHWMTARPGGLVWCTASTGWSKSSRNAFVAPWLRGAAALVHDGRFDPTERMDIIRRERVTTLCMSPTEYRMVARRGALGPLPDLQSMIAAGEALDVTTLEAWRAATGIDIRDGYGQTETGQITATPEGEPVRAGSMGKALPGVRARVDNGELVVETGSVRTMFLGYLGEGPPPDPWRTGDRVRQDADGYFYFEGRTDDVIISAGYRIGPDEVESVLRTHDAVADAAAVAAPDPERGSVVRALVVLRDGVPPSDALAADIQAHVKRTTAPYKYPRSVEFISTLPRTTTGKLRRAALRKGR